MSAIAQLRESWHILATVPGLGVGILSPDLTYIYANSQLASMYTGEPDPAHLVGRSLHNLFGKARAAETADIIRSLTGPDHVAALRSVIRGRAISTTFRPLGPRARNPDILSISQFITAITPVIHDPDVETFESATVDLGPLDVLSPRELEVLILLGEGLSIEQIAKTLHRSPHTIRHHREAIAAKLNEPNRIRLACTAATAGIHLADAARKRHRPENPTKKRRNPSRPPRRP